MDQLSAVGPAGRNLAYSACGQPMAWWRRVSMDVENRPAGGRISATMKINTRSGVSDIVYWTSRRLSRQLSRVQITQDHLHKWYKPGSSREVWKIQVF